METEERALAMLTLAVKRRALVIKHRFTQGRWPRVQVDEHVLYQQRTNLTLNSFVSCFVLSEQSLVHI